MGWAIVSVVGFGVAIGLDIGLARNNTARWERDRRAAQAAIRAREAAARRAWADARPRWQSVQRTPESPRRLPHLHLPHLPHVHLPARVVARLPHPNGRVVRRLAHRPIHLPRGNGRDVRVARLPEPELTASEVAASDVAASELAAPELTAEEASQADAGETPTSAPS